MSVRIDASGDYLSRSGGLPAGNLFSVCFWIYITTDRNAQGDLFLITNGAGSQYNKLILGNDGTTLNILDQNGNTSGTNLSTGTWYHVAYTRNGATQKAYVNGVLDITRSNNNTLTTPAAVGWGSNTVTWLNGRIANIKLWDAELTIDEINAERNQFLLRRFTNINLWCPTFTGATERLADWSGNGRNLTSNGTLTDEDQPPIPYGAAPLIYNALVGSSQDAPMNTAAVTLAANSLDTSLSITAPLNKPDVAITAYASGTALSITAAINLATGTLSAFSVDAVPVALMNTANVTLAGNNVTPVLGNTNVPMNNAAVTLAAYGLDTVRIQAINIAAVTLSAFNLTTSLSITSPMNTANVALAAYALDAIRIQAVNAAAVTLTAYALDAARIQAVGTAGVTLAALSLSTTRIQPMNNAAVTIAAYGVGTSLSISTSLNTTNVTLAAYQPTASAVVIASLNAAALTLAAFNVSTALSINAPLNTTNVSIAAYAVGTSLSISAAVGLATITIAAYSAAAQQSANTADVGTANVTITANNLTASVGAITAQVSNTNIALVAYGLNTLLSIQSVLNAAAVTLQGYGLVANRIQPVNIATAALAAYPVTYQVGTITQPVNVAAVDIDAYSMTYATDTASVGYAQIVLQAFDGGLPDVDPDRIFSVPKEIRDWIVKYENRGFIVPADDRVYIVDE